MVDQVRTFMETDIRNISKKFADFDENKQEHLKNAMNNCAKDTDFSLKKPYDFDNENFKYFALCLRNNVIMNPAINSSKGIKSHVLGW